MLRPHALAAKTVILPLIPVFSSSIPPVPFGIFRFVAGFPHYDVVSLPGKLKDKRIDKNYNFQIFSKIIFFLETNMSQNKCILLEVVFCYKNCSDLL